MTVSILAYLREPERTAMRLERLASDFDGVAVHVASTIAGAAPALADAQILISIGGHLGAEAGAVFEAMPKLEWVQSFGSGTDNIKGHSSLAPNVVVANVHGIHGPQLSEAAFAAMLSFARNIPLTVGNQDKRSWERAVPTLLAGKIVGIFGLGAIASELAPRCTAFGMRVIGISGTARDVAGFSRVYGRNALIKAVSALDYLIVLTPYTPETHHILGREVFKAMKPGACLINLARGGVVDEAALLAALDAGDIAGAALDVFETEPLPEAHPFWAHPKVIITPHIAGFHDGYPEQAYQTIAANVDRYLEGGIAALANKV